MRSIVYNGTMKERIAAFALSYFIGCILTGEIVSRAVAHKPAAELGGSGNPGMANVMTYLGFKTGIAVLCGDLSKCLFAMGLAWHMFKHQGRIILYYAGLGACFGHSLPFWRRFSGGKAVATSSALLLVYSPLWGFVSCFCGLLTALISGYLSLAGVAIPFVFLVPAWAVYGRECFILTLVLFLLCFFRHYPWGRGFPAGAGHKMHLIQTLKSILGRKKTAS